MIDFTQIRDLSAGQRWAFEELVCQIARREQVPPGSIFRRVEGSGGDGGVEAYWLLPDGTKFGYQAKFFTKTKDIDWQQIDRSVEQALETHTTLTKYFIAIACDLTDRRGAESRGKAGWDLWESHKAKWHEKSFTPTRHTVEFIPWTASDLRDKLSAPSADGLRRYWFGTFEFSSVWFRNHIDLATKSLDERYHPDDHVDVGIESLFQFTTRHEVALGQLRDGLSAVQQARLPDRGLREHELAIPSSTMDAARPACAELLSIAPEFDFPFLQEWDLARWKALSDNLIIAVGELESRAWNIYIPPTGKDNENNKNRVNFIQSELHKLKAAAVSFQNLINGRYLAAEQDRAALIKGRAGTGKSHLLGRIADVAVREERPIILLLGQHFNDQPIWEQIAKRLGLGNIAADLFLRTLDAAAETARKRGLILVDAVNEGAGARVWRPEITAFFERIKRFRNLVCIVSCRSEYVPYVIPDVLRATLQSFDVRGFETAKEQLYAARIYMDKRGISRPCAPWLAPEFVNPLFLRSTCLALNRDKKSEFPRGLAGAKAIFAFYIRSVGRNLGVGRDGSEELVPATIKALRAIAGRMAADRKDNISRAQATEIVNTNFYTFPAPQEQSWLDVLLRNGLLRNDPDPTRSISDPLALADEVVRFSFQRFQDHLMTEALLADVDDIKVALRSKGPFAFIHGEKTMEWQWQGLIDALSIQVPERFSVELVDVLPGGANHWWRIWQITDAFVESLRWRENTAFNDRTLELFNDLAGTHRDHLSLLIELSAAVDHPWNALFLHSNLLRRKLPHRDHIWTVWLNNASIEGEHPVGRLVDWCLFGQNPNVESGTQQLCGITLCWFFTPANRYIRDRATKALVALFLAQTDLMPKLVELFRSVDDIYVPERLFAAAFGACCIDPSNHRLESYATATYDAVFAEGSPPFSLLLRDYARGIIELCLVEASLPTNIAIDKCRPPYRSAAPRLTVSEADLGVTTSKAGDKAILRSCDATMGDFGRYEIAPRVRSFTSVQLSRPQKRSSQGKFDRFEAEVIEIDQARIQAFNQLREAVCSRVVIIIGPLGKDGKENVDETEYQEWAANVQAAENRLLKILSPVEARRYRKEAASQLGLDEKNTRNEPPNVDLFKAGCWIAKRAYDIGWTKKLFPDEQSRCHRHSGERPYIERVGKKYQWIALDELLCRLADNYWLDPGYGDASIRYNNPLDVGFERDIDPTIIPISDERDNSQGPRLAWVLGERIILNPTEESALCRWPFLADPGVKIPAVIQRTDPNGNSWITLYEHRSMTARYRNEMTVGHDLRQQEFRFLMCAIVAKADCLRLVEFLKEKNRLDVDEWNPPEFTDGPFLREAPWRDTWMQEQWQRDVWAAPKGMAISFPVSEYHWESHLDASLPKGARALIPSPWLAKALLLNPDGTDASIYRGAAGRAAFIGSRLANDGSSALVDARSLDNFLKANDFQCLWLFVGERNAWPGGTNDGASWRRSEGLRWLEDGKPKYVNWNKDNARGASKALVP